MRSLAVNSNNDIYIGDDGSLAVAREIYAVKHSSTQAAKAQLGEMMYATDRGLPTFDVIWNGSPNPAVYEAWLRRTLLECSGVHEVRALNVSVAGSDLKYSATIITDYGEIAING
ncbi:hypothetical protein CUR65_12130 [Salmonella enterica subsp. enterica serovar Legon]|uniref:hypothetical protein n=1 Tax=Salmonella enterica TaxID=28901 RepID=UPI000D3EC97E|nr:hypothetical protein [Salmonella enterica]ECF2272453.1 hypothetical protein [Salmonella enterica subsp. enterica serovar Durham]EED8424400.1 hypothetical protein [Salmonella enterica subsp. enterica serovar Losangeles]EEG8796171.1 hypothetical protein [Salmonella enterica subsp. enterica serovar Durham]EEP8355061.1 hypothetical protein [Salmonella enterica subsp. enterica serovar Durham]EEP8359547.1 hypothetical protein [Salmonella enterica subsp. enterica serovar Durham]